jgi:hypothetical protein
MAALRRGSERIRNISQAWVGRAGGPGPAAVRSAGDRGEAQQQARVDAGDERLAARRTEGDGAVRCDVGRGGQLPARTSRRKQEQLPEQVRSRGGAHRDDRPGRLARGDRGREGQCRGAPGGGGGLAGRAAAAGGEGGDREGCRRGARRFAPNDPSSGADDARASRRPRAGDCFHAGPRSGGLCAHQEPSACRAAWASSVANEDSVAAVPGPGSKSSSSRRWPDGAITKAVSLCPSMEPAGSVSAVWP